MVGCLCLIKLYMSGLTFDHWFVVTIIQAWQLDLSQVLIRCLLPTVGSWSRQRGTVLASLLNMQIMFANQPGILEYAFDDRVEHPCI